MRNATRARRVLAALVAGVALSGATGSAQSVSKGVDLSYAPPSATLTYTVTVANPANPAVATGLLTDDFPDQLVGCAWTCSASGTAWCELPGGTGDINQLVSVPVGTSVTVDATCTFLPAPGHECASNVAAFFTMDPDTTSRGRATTCESGVTVFFDGFESGDASAWTAASAGGRRRLPAGS